MWKFSPVFLAERNPNHPSSSVVSQSPLRGSNPALFENRGSTQFGPYYCPSVIHHHHHNSQHNYDVGEIAADPLTQCIATFYWLGILIFLAYPIGFVALVLFILLSPIAAI